MTLCLTVGAYGGFYTDRRPDGRSFRICLGWFAITIFRYDFDVFLEKALDCLEQYQEVP